MSITTVPYEFPVLDMSAKAGADLSSLQFYAMKWSSGNPLTVQKATAVTDPPAGGLMTPNTSGNDVKVRILGVGKAIAGGTITLGAWVTTDSNGKFVVETITAGTSGNIWGQALGAVSNAGEIFPCLFMPFQITAT